MATIKAFEDLEVWQLARVLCQEIYQLTSKPSFSKDFELKSQIHKSAGSIMDNIAEGFERGGNKEFIYFLSIAKGSCGETRSQLYRALDHNHLTESEWKVLSEKCIIISKKLSGLIKYLNASDVKGSRFLEPNESYGRMSNS